MADLHIDSYFAWSACHAVVKAQIDTTLKPFSFDVNELTKAFNNFPEELRQVHCLHCSDTDACEMSHEITCKLCVFPFSLPPSRLCHCGGPGISLLHA